ncbi:MAG: hypothetical protein KDA78_04485 [Planctomycetaceae bacterium]|nr:hypothetical protein [Planctomycetaceae bacterium]
MPANVKAAKDLVKSLVTDQLLGQVGKPFNDDEFEGYSVVKNWRAAVSSSKNTRYWLYAGTEVFNDLGIRIHTEWGNHFLGELNKTSDMLTRTISKLLVKVLSPELLKKVGGKEGPVFEKIIYDIRSIAMDYAYEELLPDRYFHDVIEPIYRSGHYVCGWNGNKKIKSVKHLIKMKAEVIY